MYVLVTYDVQTSDEGGTKRLRKVAKACQDYGLRVQNSVFECLLSPAQMVQLENVLSQIIDHDKDSLRFYQLGKNYQSKITVIGRVSSYEFEGELIV